MKSLEDLTQGEAERRWREVRPWALPELASGRLVVVRTQRVRPSGSEDPVTEPPEPSDQPGEDVLGFRLRTGRYWDYDTERWYAVVVEGAEIVVEAGSARWLEDWY